jgi:hypothetical protein
MKNIAAILVGAVVIAVVLSLGVYYSFGDEPGYYFALFIAVPTGLAGSGLLYLLSTAARRNKRKP